MLFKVYMYQIIQQISFEPLLVQGFAVTVTNKQSPYSYRVSISEMWEVEHLSLCLVAICISFSANCSYPMPTFLWAR